MLIIEQISIEKLKSIKGDLKKKMSKKVLNVKPIKNFTPKTRDMWSSLSSIINKCK